MTFKPMLAAPADFGKLKFPVYASPKLDGIRASVVGGRLLSRTLKEIPSRFIFNALSHHELEGFDGELIVDSPTSKTCYRDTVSGVMADHKTPNFTYYVFDLWNVPSPFSSRRLDLAERVGKLDFWNGRITQVLHVVLEDHADLDAYEAEQIALGHEGIMLANPGALYKFGRSTVNEGSLLKVKRFEDSEAEIVGVVEEMFNGNDAQTNELGRTQRSTAQAGLIGKGTMGALVVRDLTSGIEFNIGTGFTAADRAAQWSEGAIVKYKHFPIGTKDKPRHPVYLGFRDQRDMGGYMP